MMLTPSAHADTFCRDHLPPADEWPELVFSLPELVLSGPAELRRDAAAGHGSPPRSRPAVPAPPRPGRARLELRRSRRDGQADRRRADRRPRAGAGQPRAAARAEQSVAGRLLVRRCCKAGGVVVATMSLLRAAELATICDIAQVDLALCDDRFADELAAGGRRGAPDGQLLQRPGAGGPGNLNELAGRKADAFEPSRTAADDVAMIAFTSGTTGRPKGGDALPPGRAGHRRHLLGARAQARAGRRLHRHSSAGVHVRARRRW